jgi:hypothetical protein
VWARQHAPQVAHRISEEAEAFRDWHAGRRRADWSARWRTWCREACRRSAARTAPRAAAPRSRGEHVDGVRIADTGQTYEQPRWYACGTPEFAAWRAQLVRDRLADDIERLDRAGRVKLRPSTARRALVSDSSDQAPIGGLASAIVAAAASQHTITEGATS